jgi:glycolate oxidase FAD binding subunit
MRQVRGGWGVSSTALEAFAGEVGATGPVAVAGGRTAWDVGGGLDAEARIVTAPAGVVTYEPAEMTVRVGAGTTLADLDAALAGSGQLVALPSSPDATVGGALAVGGGALGRLRWGPARDVLLEARYVSADGRLVKAGGPTVKNVSGYDLCRLLVGSLGTLGLLGEVVLRTRPRPQCSRWFAGRADPWAVRDLLYRPSAVLWDGATTWVWLEGYEVDVDAEAAVLVDHGLQEAAGPPERPPHRHHLERAAMADLTGSFVAEIGTGIVHRDEPAPAPIVSEPVRELCRRIKHELDPLGRLNPGRDPLAVAR